MLLQKHSEVDFVRCTFAWSWVRILLWEKSRNKGKVRVKDERQREVEVRFELFRNSLTSEK